METDGDGYGGTGMDSLLDERVMWMRQNPPGMRDKREALAAPLFAYLHARHVMAYPLIAPIALRYGETMSRSRVSRLRLGLSPMPYWLVPGVAEALGVTEKQLMGANWVRRHGPPESFGAEMASAEMAS